MVAALRKGFPGAVVGHANAIDGVFNVASRAARGDGCRLVDVFSPARRARRWVATVAAATLAVGAGGWSIATSRGRSQNGAPVREALRRTGSAVVADALNAVPPGMSLSSLDWNAEDRSLALSGLAPAQVGIDTFLSRLAPAVFSTARCVRTSVDDGGHVRFEAVAENAR
jgi:hypothetical protein